jgi:hypothetical protein
VYPRLTNGSHKNYQPLRARALQEREFERLGSNQTKRADVRLVTATNRDLEQMMEDREFRSDLYYRLNVFPIRIPPLRERPEDVPLLVRYFAQKYSRRMHNIVARYSFRTGRSQGEQGHETTRYAADNTNAKGAKRLKPENRILLRVLVKPENLPQAVSQCNSEVTPRDPCGS